MTEQNLDLHWEEVSILISEDLAEPVINALTGIVPGGLVVERIYGDVFPYELDQITVPVRVYGYYPADIHLEEVREKITHNLKPLREKNSFPDPVYSSMEQQNWATAWQVRYLPIPLGEKLVVVPSWLKNPHPERIPIWMDPGMAFGSGTHTTTQLSLILLEECLVDESHSELLDIGCGSGILTIAGAKLGIKRAIGIDIDPDAIQVSRANAVKNEVDNCTSFQQGSVTDLLIEPGGKTSMSLVVANIIAPILTHLFNEGLGDLVNEDGKLILSGILEEQLPGIINCLHQNGFQILSQSQEGEWVAVVGEKRSPPLLS
ncbi:MAG: 50S ribosomal protein L11 methyltransferase [Chloroflexi bacterium]|nr:50S ribosomal protein L11 methyltransferase [Chloroflexota bacterium]